MASSRYPGRRLAPEPQSGDRLFAARRRKGENRNGAACHGRDGATLNLPPDSYSWPSQQGMAHVNIVSNLARMASNKSNWLSRHDRCINRVRESYVLAPNLHCISKTLSRTVMTRVHDIAQHHGERKPIRILTFDEAHQTFINIFAHQALQPRF